MSKMVKSYFFTLKLYHIDYYLSFKAFDTPQIALIIKGEKKLFSKYKAINLSIIKNIFEQLIKLNPIKLNKLNIHMVFKIA